MAVEHNGISDDVSAELNVRPPTRPNPQAKGPDESQWPPENRAAIRRKVDKFEEEGEDSHVKGPHPEEWDEDARVERGAVPQSNDKE